MSKVHAGSSPVWLDALAPAFAQGSGAAAPNDVILSTASPADSTMDVHVLGFNPVNQDRLYCSVQINHDLLVPDSGNIIFKPHVHFTFYSEPTTGQTVIFKLGYVYAKVGITAAAAGTFAAAPTILTSAPYTTVSAAEIRKHLVLPMGDITIPVAECGPSMAFMYTLKLDSSSTVNANKVVVLFTDFHYRAGPMGTDGEFS